jgi:ribosomal protein S17E
MTKEQCIQRLARRLGQQYHKPTKEEVASGSYYQYEPRFLTSIDSLRPVLATMTEEDWKKLINHVAGCMWVDHLRDVGYGEDYTKWILTLDPQQLAFAIAEALGEEGTK